MNNATLHHFRENRRHQMNTFGNTGLHINGKDVREFAGGGAVPGMHAVAALTNARRHIHFMKDLGQEKEVLEPLTRCRSCERHP